MDESGRGKVWREGGCHCGAVRFKVRHGFQEALDCNCSICRMLGFLHIIVPANDFELLHGEANQTEYRFNTGTARHLFCKQCGISSYYIPRSHPDGFDINLRCIDGIELSEVRIVDFDGREWENNISKIEGYES